MRLSTIVVPLMASEKKPNGQKTSLRDRKLREIHARVSFPRDKNQHIDLNIVHNNPIWRDCFVHGRHCLECNKSRCDSTSLGNST
jgi:hypothetical protein